MEACQQAEELSDGGRHVIAASGESRTCLSSHALATGASHQKDLLQISEPDRARGTRLQRDRTEHGLAYVEPLIGEPLAGRFCSRVRTLAARRRRDRHARCRSLLCGAPSREFRLMRDGTAPPDPLHLVGHRRTVSSPRAACFFLTRARAARRRALRSIPVPSVPHLAHSGRA
jgi:hypothetical protein